MERMSSVAQLGREDIPKLRHIPVLDADGERIGHVGDVYYDESTERVEFVGVPGDALGFKNVMVPVAGASLTEEGLRLPFGKDRLRDFGDSDDSDELDEDRWDDERDYYATQSRTENEQPTRDRSESVTRSEEELEVGTERVETGRVRLRKYVETEPVEVDVELRRETVEVERTPIDREVSGADFKEQELELPLHEERPVVEKTVVAKEEISLKKNVEVEHETVSDEVRKERVEVEDDQ